ncbi:MAG: multiheme c-type cytochrome [bacterium]|nr:multiheme c-type cytochrome [bacterium]
MTIRNYFAIILVIIVIGIMSACNSGTSPLHPDDGILRFVSADICMGCHQRVGNEWIRTKHADALPALESSGFVSSSCYVCHVVSLDGNPANSGYDDPDPTVATRFGGVQCENCHGAGSSHIATLIPHNINLDAAVCGSCHTDVHHPTYDEWQTSAHARAINERDTNTHFGVACLECHSADYIFADSVPENASVNDFQFSITCVVCHDPHDNDNEFQLRKKPLDLCYQCHTSEGAVPGMSPHHPNGDIYQGLGGYEYPNHQYENSAHSSFEEACVTCHMWTAPFSATGSGENAISGHTFLPRIEACNECHPDATDFNIYGAQTEIQGLIDELTAELDAATANDKQTVSYQNAKFNRDFIVADGTRGVHNVKYARALLQDSIDDFEPGS